MKIQEIKTSKFDGFGALVPEDAIETYPNKPSVVLFKDNDLVYFPKEGDGKLIYRLGKGEFKIARSYDEFWECCGIPVPVPENQLLTYKSTNK